MVINICDLLVFGFLIVYFIRNLGGLFKTTKTILLMLLYLIIFGIIASLVLQAPFLKPAHETLNSAYSVKFSVALIKLVYPAVEMGAPKVDQFVKEKIINAPNPDIALPKVITKEKSLPRIPIRIPTITGSLPAFPGLKLDSK